MRRYTRGGKRNRVTRAPVGRFPSSSSYGFSGLATCPCFLRERKKKRDKKNTREYCSTLLLVYLSFVVYKREKRMKTLVKARKKNKVILSKRDQRGLLLGERRNAIRKEVRLSSKTGLKGYCRHVLAVENFERRA